MMTLTPTSLIKPEEALQERIRRERARRHLVDFSEYVAPWYRAAAHHRLVGEYLELVETFIRTRGTTGISRLLILQPPRHGKSEQVSRMFPPWIFGRNPDARIILASYGGDLASKHSRAAREILMSDRYRAVFGNLATTDAPVELSGDSRSVVAWDLAAPHRGGLLAAGVGGGITGSGANIFILDDPVKNREEAESESNRERVWEWWTSTAYTRLEDGGAVIGMLTRWYQDDWAGRLLKAMVTDPQADQWVVLCLPDIWEPPQVPEGKPFSEYHREKLLEGVWVDENDPLGRQPGQALWAQKYNEEDLERIAANIGTYDYQALYRQNPYLRLGNFFMRDWLPVVDELPKPEKIVARIRSWDKAGTKTGSGGDYSVGVLMCMTSDEAIYVEHVVRGRWTPGKREEMMLKTAQLDAERKGPKALIWHQQDPGSAGLDSAQATNRMLAKHEFRAHFETVTGDKEVRAGPWSSACEGGQVRLVRGGWNEAFIEEHLAFPKGQFDDQVDAASIGYSKLSGHKKKREPKSYQG